MDTTTEPLLWSDIPLEEIVDHHYYAYYPTVHHQASHSRWWSSGKELRQMIVERKRLSQEYERHLIWGK